MRISCLNVCNNKKQNIILRKRLVHFFITALVEQLVMNKSSLHLELEQALKENKQTIFRMPSNSSDLY